MDFIVRSPLNKTDVVEVRYDCPCGCKPRARYQQGTDEAGHEHCCCGRVHFVGMQAEERLKSYLEDRRTQGLDDEVGGYTLHSYEVAAPWGDPVPVAYALPNVPKPH